MTTQLSSKTTVPLVTGSAVDGFVGAFSEDSWLHMSPLQHVTVQLAPSGKRLFRQAAKKHNNLGVDRNEARQEAVTSPPGGGGGWLSYGRIGKAQRRIRIKILILIRKYGRGSDFNWRLKMTITQQETISRNKLRTLKVIVRVVRNQCCIQNSLTAFGCLYKKYQLSVLNSLSETKNSNFYS